MVYRLISGLLGFLILCQQSILCQADADFCEFRCRMMQPGALCKCVANHFGKRSSSSQPHAATSYQFLNPYEKGTRKNTILSMILDEIAKNSDHDEISYNVDTTLDDVSSNDSLEDEEPVNLKSILHELLVELNHMWVKIFVCSILLIYLTFSFHFWKWASRGGRCSCLSASRQVGEG